jgi:hypothetical protein
MTANEKDAKSLIEQLLVAQDVTMVGGCHSSQIVGDLPYTKRDPPGERARLIVTM